MKVLWFSLSPGGSIRRNGQQHLLHGWMLSLEDELKKDAAIDLHIAYISSNNDTSFEYDGVTYHPIIRPRFSKLKRVFLRHFNPSFAEKLYIQQMDEIVRACNPDIVHIHGSEEVFLDLIERIQGVPVCLSVQGLISACLEKYYSGYSREEIDSYNGFIARLRGVSSSKVYDSFRMRAERELCAIKRLKYIIGRTDWDYSIMHMLNPSADYYKVNEILRKDFYEYKWENTDISQGVRLLTILSPGQIYKGYELLIRCAGLLKKYSPFKFQWNVVGYSEDYWIADMTHKSLSCKNSECNVNLLGVQDACAISELMRKSHIYIQTSHIENSPNSVCEAMLVGLPVIATNVGGTSSILESFGILVPEGDSHRMASAVILAVEDWQHTCLMAEKGSLAARNRHEPSKVVKSLIDVYYQIVSTEKSCDENK